MFLDNLISPHWAALADPRNFVLRLRYPELVSFGLLANLDAMRKKGVLEGIDAIIDVGANRGQFAYMASRVCPDVPVVSVEPDPDSFRGLKKVFDRFSIRGTCLRTALSDHTGIAKLNRYASDACNSLLSPVAGDMVVTGSEDVEVTTLDAVADEAVADARRLFLKIDVQGAELNVLAGALRTLRRCALVLVEVSFRQSYEGGARLHEVLACLDEQGFRVLEIIDTLRERRGRGASLKEADLLLFNERLEEAAS